MLRADLLLVSFCIQTQEAEWRARHGTLKV